MAILKDLIVNGATRLIGDAFANKITISTLADSAGNIGTNGQVLRSDGENIVWSTDNKANITTTANSVAYYSDTSGTFASDADFLWDATNNKLTAEKLNGYVIAGQKSGTTLGTKATAEGNNTTASGANAHAEGDTTTASSASSHAEGYQTIASGNSASKGNHAEGYQTTASGQSGAHAEGYLTTASGNFGAHAEGYQTTANGQNCSHAEGYNTTASGLGSHAEGQTTTASGTYSHTEGGYSTASGIYTHAEGYATTAQRRSQHVFGEANILDTEGTGVSKKGAYIEIVGNGTASDSNGVLTVTTRSNARTLDWNGNESLAGNLLPMVTNSKTLGNSSLKWSNVYATTFTGNLTGNADTATALQAFVVSQYTIPAGKGVRIQYPSHTPVLISCQRATGGSRLILLGGGYGADGATRNDFTEVVSCNTSQFTWSLPESSSISNSIEIMHHNTSGTAKVVVWAENPCSFIEITALTTAAQNRNLLHSKNYTNWTVQKDGTGATGTWDISITGNADTATKANITTTANSVAYYSDATGTFASDADFLWDATNNKLTAAKLNGYVMAGQKSGTTLGSKATAEGFDTVASGVYSHAEGYYTSASGNFSHAEGNYTAASGDGAHAEGYGDNLVTWMPVLASGQGSHAEGYVTTASGDWSHAEGYLTTAQRKSQHVFGEFNILDTTGNSKSVRGSYIEIVGNGTSSSARSNARTLDWNGNERLAGNLLPMVTNSKTLGTNSLRWKEVQTRTVNSLITGTGVGAKDNLSGNNRYMPAKWTFNTGANATNGDVYTIKVPCAGHSYGVFMSVNNGINYYPVVCGNDLTSRLIAQYPKEQMIQVIFDSNGSAASMYPLEGGTARVTVPGGVFRVINYYDTNSNTLTSAQCETAAGTAAKVADCTYWTAKNKSYIHVNFRYANSSQSAITLNINSTGRKAIWINGAASSASNYTLPAGSYLAYYQNDKFYFRTDGFLPSLGFIDSTKTSYGEILPETGTEGQIFFQLSDGYTYELPAGGAVDEMLVKNSATDRNVKWTRDYVKRTGDTMTGSLNLQGNLGECISHYITNITKGTAPSTPAYSGIWFCDSTLNNSHNGGRLSGLEHCTGDHYNQIYIRAYKPTAGSSNSAQIYVTYNADGSTTAGSTAPFYGAVWNDYAECRETKEDIEPGRCIREIGDDTLELTTERLMRGCEIVSDTFGFAIGQSEKAKTPTAASGRVLAYLYEDKEEARQKIGWPVCSGPNGTVSIMTEEEEEKYPSRIIGTISAVPDYEIWYGGNNGDTPIQVNGRIWIRIR